LSNSSPNCVACNEGAAWFMTRVSMPAKSEKGVV
jgi:hypothetical protein